MIVLAAAALAVAAASAPAEAGILELTTTIPLADADNQAAVRAALEAAVEDALGDEAPAFTPALVVVTRAIVVGDRMLLRLLVADREGAETVRALAAPTPPPPDAIPGLAKTDL